jgi:hypothetical protein
MRTTLTLDADVARTLKTKARSRKISWKEAVNDALRAGLGLQVGSRPKGAFVVKPHDGGFRPGIDPRKLGKLAAELEDEHILSRLAKQ